MTCSKTGILESSMSDLEYQDLVFQVATQNGYPKILMHVSISGIPTQNHRILMVDSRDDPILDPQILESRI